MYVNTERIKNEPVMALSAIAAAVITALGPLNAGGWIGPELSEAVKSVLGPNGIVLAAGAIVLGLLQRRQTFGPKTVATLVAEAEAKVPDGYVALNP